MINNCTQLGKIKIYKFIKITILQAITDFKTIPELTEFFFLLRIDFEGVTCKAVSVSTLKVFCVSSATSITASLALSSPIKLLKNYYISKHPEILGVM